MSGTDTHAGWTAALDRLEADVHELEVRRLDDLAAGPPDVPGATPWEAPADLGPIPAPLVPRAREVLARQRDAAAALADALERTARQQRYAERVSDSTTTAQPPAYLDVTA